MKHLPVRFLRVPDDREEPSCGADYTPGSLALKDFFSRDAAFAAVRAIVAAV